LGDLQWNRLTDVHEDAVKGRAAGAIVYPGLHSGVGFRAAFWLAAACMSQRGTVVQQPDFAQRR
jgi:hypothetical protein